VLEILHIFAGERRGRELDAGKVDAFVIAEGAAGDDFAADGDGVCRERFQLNAAVGEQDRIAGPYILGKVSITGGGEGRSSEQRLRGDGENGSLFEVAAASFETAEADFRALEIEKDAGVYGKLSGGFTDGGDAGEVVFPGPVAGVEPENVNAGVEHAS